MIKMLNRRQFLYATGAGLVGLTTIGIARFPRKDDEGFYFSNGKAGSISQDRCRASPIFLRERRLLEYRVGNETAEYFGIGEERNTNGETTWKLAYFHGPNLNDRNGEEFYRLMKKKMPILMRYHDDQIFRQSMYDQKRRIKIREIGSTLEEVQFDFPDGSSEVFIPDRTKIPDTKAYKKREEGIISGLISFFKGGSINLGPI